MSLFIRVLSCGLVAVAIVSELSAEASAQVFSPYSQLSKSKNRNRKSTSNRFTSKPRVNPLVNLSSQGSLGTANPGLAYFGVVRPENQLRNAALNQESVLNQLTRDRAGRRDQDEPESVTGHATFFLNYSPYYPGLGTSR